MRPFSIPKGSPEKYVLLTWKTYAINRGILRKNLKEIVNDVPCGICGNNPCDYVIVRTVNQQIPRAGYVYLDVCSKSCYSLWLIQTL